MKKIRASIFETNSSSTHSISIKRGGQTTPTKIDKVYFGEFGWENRYFNNCYDKLSYLITSIRYFYPEEEVSGWLFRKEDDFEKNKKEIEKWMSGNKHFQWLHEMVKEFTGQDFKVALNDNRFHPMGYIDHQSSRVVNEYGIWSFSKETFKENVKNFVFNNAYAVQTGNDNG